MPQLLYFVCAESGAEDKTTGQLSCFSIVEGIAIGKTKIKAPIKGANVLMPMPLFVVATWARDRDESPENEFEFQFLIRMPGSDKDDVAASDKFYFVRQRHRLTLKIQGILFDGPGTLVISCRIRKVGEQEWITASYPIGVEQIKNDKSDEVPTESETEKPANPPIDESSSCRP